MIRELRLLFALCVMAACLNSCDRKNDQAYKTAEGANERVTALEREKKDLLAELKRKETELAAAKTTMATDFDKQLTTLKELHGQRVADLEGRVASLQIQLGSTTQERLVLQEIVDRREHGPDLLRARFNLERLVWAACVFAAVIPLVWVTTRHVALKRSLNPYLLRRAAAAQIIVEES